MLVEERQFKGQIDSKLEIVIAKVDQLNDRVNIMFGRETQDLQVSSGISAQALLHTITRIVEDNERLGREVEEQSESLAKATNQVTSLLEENQRALVSTSRVDEERNTIFNTLQQQQKKKIDQLIDERENLQIEMGHITSDMAKIDQENNKLRKKYTTIVEELQIVREEADRERKLKEAGAEDVEAAKQELSNFKQRYREENRRMNEAVTEKQHLLQELGVVRERAERLQAQLDERLRTVENSKMTEQNEWLDERNTLQEEIQKLKTVLQTRTKEARDRIEEMKNELLQQQEDDRAAFRQHARQELDRRVTIAVQQALDNAAVQASTDTQKAVTEARLQYQKEKENALALQQEDFQVRLAQEVKDAYERGRRQGITEGLGAKADGSKPAELLNSLDGGKSSEEVAALEQTIADLQAQLDNVKASATSAVRRTKREGLKFLHDTSRALMNETFKSLRANLSSDNSYEAGEVLALVRNTLVASTTSVLPPMPEDEEEDDTEEDSFALLKQKQELQRQQHQLTQQYEAMQREMEQREENLAQLQEKLQKQQQQVQHQVQHQQTQQVQQHQQVQHHHEQHEVSRNSKFHEEEEDARPPVREERPEITLAANPLPVHEEENHHNNNHNNHTKHISSKSSSSTSSFEDVPEPVVAHKAAPVETHKHVEEPKPAPAGLMAANLAPVEVVNVSQSAADLWADSDSDDLGLGDPTPTPAAATTKASQTKSKSVWDESDQDSGFFSDTPAPKAAAKASPPAAAPAKKEAPKSADTKQPEGGLVDNFFEKKEGANIWGDDDSDGDLWS